ncbi:N-succinylarginine dihydrolase [Marinagarivorans algicola]|uniref:N-succinylarginine dihydrolase n=1 Tax=Marinagarivorans algicola TaxID=1513270 RepID=UPI000A89F03F|nr:N-succinylarginine dihydrolase [Marinagarivorans algicola]
MNTVDNMNTQDVREVNFDGLIGPTHNYSGLSFGNLASARNAQLCSNPQAAALQGLAKMRRLLTQGYTQGFMPPQQRPQLETMRQLGFTGSDQQIINQLYKRNPRLLSMVYSASPMWAANAATVTPSTDSGDGLVHFTPANLLTTPHRAMEAQATTHSLRTIFNNAKHFKVHAPLPSNNLFADEGAANHSRLCQHYGKRGIAMFAYGRDGIDSGDQPSRFPARQTRLASEAVARSHGVNDDYALFCRQHPVAIDTGAFHNDVVAVANGPVLFFHQLAFATDDFATIKQQLAEQFAFMPLSVNHKDVPLEDAIKSYLFNSQLLAAPNGDMTKMHLIAPSECAENTAVSRYLNTLVQDEKQPIRTIEFVDVRESMSNGGGPACLRLRVVLNEQQRAAVNPAFMLTDAKITALEQWVKKHYRDKLLPDDLADPSFYTESLEALNALTDLLQLESFYPFQQTSTL